MLTACGGPFEPKAECRVEGFTVYGEGDLDCALVASRMALAREVLVSRGLVPEEKFASVFGDVTIWAHDRDVFDSDAFGEYVPGSLEIQVNRKLQGLVHEMLHRWDEFNHRPVQTPTTPEGRHVGWDSNGYDAASIAYHRECLRI